MTTKRGRLNKASRLMTRDACSRSAHLPWLGFVSSLKQYLRSSDRSAPGSAPKHSRDPSLVCACMLHLSAYVHPRYASQACSSHARNGLLATPTICPREVCDQWEMVIPKCFIGITTAITMNPIGEAMTETAAGGSPPCGAFNSRIL